MTSPSKSYQAFEKSTHVSTPTLTLTKRKQPKTKPTFTFTRDTWKTLIGTWLALYICASATILGLNASSPTTSGWWLCGTYLLNTSLLLVSCRVTEGLVTVLRTKALPKNPSNLLIMFMGSSFTMNICNVALFAVIFTPSSHFPTAESFFLLLLQILSTITLFVHLMVYLARPLYLCERHHSRFERKFSHHLRMVALRNLSPQHLLTFGFLPSNRGFGDSFADESSS